MQSARRSVTGRAGLLGQVECILLDSVFLDTFADLQGLGRLLQATGLLIPSRQAKVQSTVFVCAGNTLDLANGIVNSVQRRVGIGKVRSRPHKLWIRLQSPLSPAFLTGSDFEALWSGRSAFPLFFG
jgi:hypothetical protein